MDVKLYLALAGALGVAYVSYSYLNKPKTLTLSKQLTKRICQEIKHQMMIVCITYSKAMKKIRQDNMEKLKGKVQEVFQNFRNQLSQVYVSKQQLILRKYAVSRQTYGKSLQKWKHQKSIVKNTGEILDMMERAINGQTPDFTVPKQTTNTFNRNQLCQIYKGMVTMIGKKVTHKLVEQVQKNPSFNPASDDDFRNAIRELSIYDLKVDFLRSKGFKQEWGCPNEIFFKYLESEKTKDEQYEKKVVAYEKCYEKIIQMVSVDPKSLPDHKIQEMFEQALNAGTTSTNVPVSKSAVRPLAPQPVARVIQQPKIISAPRQAPKPQPVDEDAQLEALMMQQLLSRSQQQPQEQQAQQEQQQKIVQSLKLGLTTSQIQQDWQKHAQINEKPLTRIQQASEQVLVGHIDKELVKSQQKVVDQAIRQAELQQEEQKLRLQSNLSTVSQKQLEESQHTQNKIEQAPAHQVPQVAPQQKVNEPEHQQQNKQQVQEDIPIDQVVEAPVVVEVENIQAEGSTENNPDSVQEAN